MRIELSSLIGAGLLAASLSALAADLTVAFVQPDKYADAGYSRSFPDDRELAQVQNDIERHLQRLSERYLSAGDSLKIDVLDIDLAGHVEPFRSRSGTDVRVVREVTWPRIELRYVLSRGGHVVASAEERVTDMNFLRAGNRYPNSDRLRYEKAMLDDWFEKRIGKRQQR